MKYLKYFEQALAYEAYKNGSDYVLPNVSYVVETKGVSYDPKKAFTLRAKYNATSDNLVAFTGASNIASLKVNGTPIEFEPIKNENIAFDVLGENISLDMETLTATCPESYLIKSPMTSWSFKAKDPNYIINENTYIGWMIMIAGTVRLEAIPLSQVMGQYFTTNDGVTLELTDAMLSSQNAQIQSDMQVGFTLMDVDVNSGTIVFIDTEHQANVTTGGLSTYSFDSEGSYDVEIELSNPDIKSMKFAESSLISIEIGLGVTSIGDSAFSGCSSLTSITIPDSVTSIGGSAFEDCSGLTSIVIPNSVTSIGGSAFYGCSSLTSITIPDSVTSIGGSAFYSCNNLTTVTIGNSVTSIGGSAFSGCSSLTSITIGLGVTSIGNSAFRVCSSLTSITIPDSVTTIGMHAFRYCSSLNEITCLATTAPSIDISTFNSVKENGILKVPAGSDYSSWMSTGDYYLGKYNWTLEYI